MSRGRKRTLIPLAFQDLSIWPAPDMHSLVGDKRTIFSARREAVEMYAAGESQERIKDRTGKTKAEVERLVKRCISSNGNGGILGFAALIYGTHIAPYRRQKTIVRHPGSGAAGCAGAMQQLFDQYPEIEVQIEELLFKKGGGNIVHEACISYLALHKAFKLKLRELGLTDNDWPFNTKNCGYKSLIAYCKILQERHLGRWIYARSGKDAARRSSVGNGYTPIITTRRPLSHVQLDFHKIDASGIVVFVNEFGGELEVPLSRWHIGLLADEFSHAVLGIHIALEANPSGDAVLETIDSAIRPEFEGNLQYPNALLNDPRILPCQLYPEIGYQGFTSLKVDNAWSNSAKEVVNNIIDTVGCAVNFGPVRAWWRRPLIERIFGELTRKGIQRLPSTYGAGPGDTRRDDPQGQALRYRIMLSDLTTIIFKCIREYNETPTEGLQFSSPINTLRTAIQGAGRRYVSQYLPQQSKLNLRLLMHVQECTVRGNIKKHIRPHITCDRCRYTSEYLANSYELVGKKLVVYFDRRDHRQAWAVVKETGEELGPLMPEQRWAAHPISIRDKKMINRAGLSMRLRSESDDPVFEFGKQKVKELRDQRKRASQKKRPSKDGLTLARISSSMAPQPSVTPEPKSETSLPETDVFEFFGLGGMPSVVSFKRRP